MMAAIQLRHAKIWYAAKLKNWDLADYELRQLEANLNQALHLYPSKPASDADASYKAVVLISEFLKAKDDAKFMQAFAQMTTACNSCHEATERSFIVVRRPVFPSPFSNQRFAPRKK
jgi:hypothetical protein